MAGVLRISKASRAACVPVRARPEELSWLLIGETHGGDNLAEEMQEYFA